MSTVTPRRRGRRQQLPAVLEIEVMAQQAGVHPELVRRLVRLGLLDSVGGPGGVDRFSPDAPARLARAVRLRRDLGLDYAGAVLASELLARIDQLEERLRRYERATQRPR
jgi:DNA-binding transcriptional MerR regulator